MHQELKTYLQEFAKETASEIKGLEEKKYRTTDQDSNQLKILKENLRELLVEIAQNGDVSEYSWP